jgi:hypothetical protein
MQELHLDKSYSDLIAFKPRLEAMKVNVRKHAAVSKLERLDNERDVLIDAFRNVVKALRHVELPSIKPNVVLLTQLMNDHKANTIATANRTSETERLLMLEKDMDADKKLQDATTALGLEPVAMRLFEANSEYNELFVKYIEETGAEEKVDIVMLRKECNNAITQFFNAIQYCSFEYEDQDYMPLANELNRLNEYYITQLKARATRNKNRKKGDNTSEKPIVPPEE